MKKLISKQVIFCDECNQEADYAYECRTCKKEHCYSCKEKTMVVYPHAVHFSGSGDGAYCKTCDQAHQRTGTDPLYSAYAAIKALRTEEAGFLTEFKSRCHEAERKLGRLIS